MARRNLPSISSLVAFEAVARQLNFTRAAEDLCISQAAVSRQIAVLEGFLHTRLFHRDDGRAGVRLSEAGERFLNRIVPGLDTLEAATDEQRGVRPQATLNLAVMPTFAAKWLLPRMPRFTEAHPDITIHFSARSEPFNFGNTNFDGAIHYGQADWAGAHCVKLFPDEMLVVCRRDLLDPTLNGSAMPGDIAALPKLHLITRPNIWRTWYEKSGLPPEEVQDGPHFETFAFLIEAAIAGMGVGLVPSFMVEQELQSSRLICPTPISIPGPGAYYLVYPQSCRSERALAQFEIWLKGESQ
jgi:LysR family glycine cleavage system transcriptional activator